jgi:hypothetical protein
MKTISQPKNRTAARRTATASAHPRTVSPDMVGLRRILVPVDFSEPSLRAVPYALSFARQFKAELILVHIVEQIVYPGD